MKALKFKYIDTQWLKKWHWGFDPLYVVNWDSVSPPPRAFTILFLGYLALIFNFEETTK